MHFVWSRLQNVNEDVDELEVFRVIEEDKADLPELLSMHRGPGQLASLHLRLPFVKGAELLVVLIKVGEKLFQNSLDFSVDPGAITELDHKV